MCCFSGVRSGDVPHSGAGLPDQQGVRALLQVHAQREGFRVLRGDGHQEQRGHPEEELPSHCCGDSGAHLGPHSEQDPQREEHQALCAGRVRQDVGTVG